MGLGPAEAKPQTEIPGARSVVLRARILGHVQTGNSDRPRRSRHLHELIEDDRGLIGAAMTLRLEADAIDRAVDLRDAQDLLQVIGHGAALREVDRFAPKGTRLREPL